mmetsp:Transcript_5225/g.479  ORF Transcript_5225/g.479 Transcript_5225/m.479 type:complete len:91 (-) Transcript_5225:144-416(-)
MNMLNPVIHLFYYIHLLIFNHFHLMIIYHLYHHNTVICLLNLNYQDFLVHYFIFYYFINYYYFLIHFNLNPHVFLSQVLFIIYSMIKMDQ